jgi:hypothetical protein
VRFDLRQLAALYEDLARMISEPESAERLRSYAAELIAQADCIAQRKLTAANKSEG